MQSKHNHSEVESRHYKGVSARSKLRIFVSGIEILMLLLVFSMRCFLHILIITFTDGDMSHFARVGIFNSGLLMTNFGL